MKYCQEKAKLPFVTVKGRKYYAENDRLELYSKEITDISEIKGLGDLINLKELYLFDNQITEIKGLDTLTNLQMLNLNRNRINELKGLKNLKNLERIELKSNRIKEIKGFEYLRNLKEVYLDGNPIRDDELHLIGKRAQEIVNYCHEKIGQKRLYK